MTTQTVSIKYVNQGLTQAQAGINAFNKSLMNLQKQSKSSSSFKFAGQDIFPSKVASNVKKQIGDMVTNVGKAVPGFNQLTQAFSLNAASAAKVATVLGGVVIGLGALAVAAAAATAAFKVFFDTGKRGLEIESTLKAFGNSIASFGDADTVLKNLRKETRGTISDVELMRLTVQSLQGTSQEFRRVVAPELGKVFDVTARAARATGQSADEVRSKFLNGLRRQSKLLLDDIGVTVDAAKAQEAYAKQIGKTASQLTDIEKQAAFAQEAIRQLDNIGKEAGVSSFSETFSKASALFQNFRDQISVAILPIFKPFVQQLDLVINAISRLAGFGITVFAAIAEDIGFAVSALFKMTNASLNFIATVTGFKFFIDNLEYVIALFLIVRDVVNGVARAIYGELVKAFIGFKSLINDLNPLPQVAEQINIDLIQLAFNLGKGGAAIIGAFAAGILKGGVVVAKAVNKIAQIVADFLVGFSPPKMGPLSDIDKGGENVIRAWADGFASGIRKPLNEVTNYVSMRLGEIGTFSRDQVESRLLQLDAALQPFKDSLDIVKADLEAISGFVDPALEALDRQREGIIKKFALGGTATDLSQLRFLDAQAERLKELKTLEQDRVDQAQIQLALVQSSQVQERTLLNIRKAQLGETEKINSETSKAQKEVGDKVPKGAGGSGAGGAGDEIGGGFVGGAPPDFLKNEEIERAKQQIKDFGNAIFTSGKSGIAAGLAGSGAGEQLGALQAEIGKLGATQARIKGADPVGAITDKFKGLGEGVLEPLETFKTNVQTAFDSLFSPDAGTITQRINGFLTGLSTAFSELDFSGLTEIFNTAFGEEGTITGAFNTFKTSFAAFFGEGEESTLVVASTALATFVDTSVAKITELKDGLTEAITEATTAFNGFFNGDQSILMRSQLAATAMVSNVVAAFASFTGDGAGTIKGALAGFSEVLIGYAVNPVYDAMQLIIDGVVNAFNLAINAFNESTPFGDIDNIGQVKLERPTLRAKGGFNINKPFIAGEKGAELIVPKKPVNIFPTQATAALQSLAAMPMYYGGGTTNNNNTNIQNTYNVNSVGQASLLQRQQAAMMR